jgi:glycosyltransferase involved in cell wall biosynthesis
MLFRYLHKNHNTSRLIYRLAGIREWLIIYSKKVLAVKKTAAINILNHWRIKTLVSRGYNPIQRLREVLETTHALLDDGLPLSESLGCINRCFLEYDWELRAIPERPRLHRHPDLQDIAEKLRCALLHLMPQQETPSILVLLPDAETAGGQTAAVRLANEFAKTHRVFVVNARPCLNDGNLSTMISDRIAFLEGDLCSLAHLRFSFKHPDIYDSDLTPIRLSSLSSLCDWLGIEVAFSHVWWADKLAHKLIQATSMRWFLHMHGCYEFLIQANHFDTRFPDLARQIFQRVRGVFYLHDKNLAVFDQLQIPKPTLRLARNGFEKPILSSSSIESLPFPRASNEIVFCMCARGIPEKGWESAIQATLFVNELPPSDRGNKKARLIAIGSSEYLDRLLKEHAHRPEITSMGLQRSPVEIMSHCHVGLLPTYFVSESQPNVVIEYMAAGLAVISTDIGSIPGMLVQQGHTAGVAIKHNDMEQLRKELIQEMANLMRDESILKQRRSDARRIFKLNYDIKIIARETLRLFDEL